jgi:hypothetical protein
LIVLQLVQADAPFAARREMAGLQEALAGLAARVPDGRPLFVEQLGAALATPLRYIEGKDAIALPAPVAWESLWRLLQDWPPGEDTAYLLVGQPPAVLRGGLAFIDSGLLNLDLVGTEETLDRLPREALQLRLSLQLLRVERGSAGPTSVELTLAAPVWTTTGCLGIDMPAPVQPLTVRLQVAGFRPENVPPAEVRVSWEDVLVADTTLDRSWEVLDVELRVPPPPEQLTGRDEVRLHLCVETWNPRAAGYNDDPRDLGLLFKSLMVGEGN